MWNRIVAVAAERVASTQTLGADPAAARDAMTRDRFRHVVRATRRVAAAAGEERREQNLVGANHRQRGALKHARPSTIVSTAATGIPPRRDRTARRGALDAARRQHQWRWTAC